MDLPVMELGSCYTVTSTLALAANAALIDKVKFPQAIMKCYLSLMYKEMFNAGFFGKRNEAVKEQAQ